MPKPHKHPRNMSPVHINKCDYKKDGQFTRTEQLCVAGIYQVDADGDREHVGDHPALRAGAKRLRDSAAGFGLLRRHRQHRGDLAPPQALKGRWDRVSSS